jgi:hypothetical protein
MTTATGFQNKVNSQPGVAEAGDFADANIRATVLAGPGALVSAPGSAAPYVGHFAWGDQATGQASSLYQGSATAKLGFMHRENNAIIVSFLAGAAVQLESGLPVTLYDQGSFWASFANGAVVGQSVFANYLDGSVYAAAAGTSTEDFSATGVIAVTTGILTISGSVTGTVKVGDVLSGTGVPAGTAITAQLSGTPGGDGTYQTTITTAVGSTTITGNGSVQTQFTVDSPASAGELAKISTWG